MNAKSELYIDQIQRVNPMRKTVKKTKKGKIAMSIYRRQKTYGFWYIYFFDKNKHKY